MLNLTTLKDNNNTYTANISSTLNEMMDYFIPEDFESSDGAHDKRTRQLITVPMHTTDDIPFTTLEIKAALEKFDPGKHQA